MESLRIQGIYKKSSSATKVDEKRPQNALLLQVSYPQSIFNLLTGVLILVLVLKDSLGTFLKSLSWSLGVRSLSLSLGGHLQEVLVLVLGGQVLVLVLGGQVLVNIPA